MADFNLAELAKPFRPDELEWRIQRSGLKDGRPWAQALVYVTARAVFDRLDAVVGCENWKNTEPKPVYGTKTLYSGTRRDWKKNDDISSYSYDQSEVNDAQAYDTQQNCLLGFNMGIAIRINGEWVERWDGADVTDVEPYKGGISSAWKRAAVPWGIGRYLYSFDQAWADFDHANARNSKLSAPIQGNYYSWLPPLIGEEFLPEDWSGDQYAHLMKNQKSKVSKPKATSAPGAQKPAQEASEPLKPRPATDNQKLKDVTTKLADLGQKALMASSSDDKESLRKRLATAREYCGQLFANAEIDQNDLNLLLMMISSAEGELK